MPWIQLTLHTTADKAEPISDLLDGLGAAAVTFEDASDQPIFEPDPGETRLWNNTRIVGLFEADHDMNEVVAALKAKLDNPDSYRINIDPLEDKDWERAWMDNFKPIRCGKRLWICPSWHTPQDADAVNVMLDPGLAFGTGTHPTTLLCLQWLDSHPPTNKTVIDFGCGSGILAIAAALLGAEQVEAVDHDPQAILATRDNAEKNSVAHLINTDLPKGFESEPVDLMLANILANPLLELGPQLAGLVKAGGQIVLSGILTEQAEEVRQRYLEWFDMPPPAIQEEWVRLEGVKR